VARPSQTEPRPRSSIGGSIGLLGSYDDLPVSASVIVSGETVSARTIHCGIAEPTTTISFFANGPGLSVAPAAAEDHMPVPRTLVIGSTRHQHVTSIPWEDVGWVNILDFDIVVVNMRSVTDQFLKQSKNLSDLRKKLARLLITNVKVVVIEDFPRNVKVEGEFVSNYSWSPLRWLIPLSQVGQYLGLADRIRNGAGFESFGRS
jgi:hypothetical protein